MLVEKHSAQNEGAQNQNHGLVLEPDMQNRLHQQLRPGTAVVTWPI
jgi:hypothetical protein